MSVLLAGQVSDPDAGAVTGIAVIGADTTNGNWQYTTDGGSTWLDFSTVDPANARLLAADALSAVRFVPVANWNWDGSGTVPNGLTLRAWDQTSGSAGGTADASAGGGSAAFSSASFAASVTVDAVNDAPLASGNASLAAVLEDATAPAGATVASLFAGRFSDAADAANPAMNQFAGVAVVAQAALSSQGAWQFSTDGGSSWANFGALSDTTAVALATTDWLRFLPAANYQGTPGGLTVRLLDNSAALGSGATRDVSANGGSSAISAATVVLGTSITAVNDAPAGSTSTATTAEDTAYTFSAADFGFSDNNDSPANAWLAVQISTLPAVGSLALNGVAVTAGQVVSAADINAGRLVFTPAANANGNAYASLGFQVQDNGGVANGGIDLDPTERSWTIDVTPVNDAPLASGSAVLAAVLEDAAAPAGATVGSLFGANFSDATDAANPAMNQFAGVAVVAQSALAGQGAWQFSTDSGVSWSSFASLSDTTALALATTDRLRFVPAANYNGTPGGLTVRLLDNAATISAGAVVDVSVNGGATAISAATVALGTSITAVNDAPAGTASTATTAEDRAYTFSAGDFGFSDNSDSPANAWLAVRLNTLPGAGSLALNGVAVAAGQMVSAADINAGRLVFTPAANANGNAYASLGFQVQDNGGVANGGIDLDPTERSWTIDVTPVNDAPLASGSAVLAAVLEDATAPAGASVASLFAANFSDAADAANPAMNQFAGVAVVAQSALAGQGAWQFSTDSGVSWAAFSSLSDTTALTLATTDRLRFVPAANYNGTPGGLTVRLLDNAATISAGAVVDVSVNGGSTAISAATVALGTSITAVNDAPAGTASTATTAEDRAYTFSAADFGFSDNNDSPANAWLAVQISTLPGVGSLALNGVAVTAGQVVSAADINAGRLVFTPVANANGNAYASLGFQVQDNGGVANGGIDLDPTERSWTIDVTPVNDAPLASGSAVLAAVLKDAAAPAGATVGNLFGANFSDAADVANPGSNQLAGVAVVAQAALPSQGAWQFSIDGGSTWAAVGTVSDASALTLATIDRLRFLPAASYSGTPGSLTVRLLDQVAALRSGAMLDVTANGGSTAISAATVALGTSVRAFNNPPTGSVGVLGAAVPGARLLADTVTVADADGLGAFAYQWLRDGAAIPGATGSSLLLGTDDLGATISLRLSYIDGGGGGGAEQLVSVPTAAVAHVNNAPTAPANLAAQSVQAGSSGQWTVDPGLFADADAGDALRLSAQQADGTALPAWLQFDAGSGLFSAAPGTDAVGAWRVLVTVTDAAGASASVGFTLTVTAAPPAAPAAPAPVVDASRWPCLWPRLWPCRRLRPCRLLPNRQPPAAEATPEPEPEPEEDTPAAAAAARARPPAPAEDSAAAARPELPGLPSAVPAAAAAVESPRGSTTGSRSDAVLADSLVPQFASLSFSRQRHHGAERGMAAQLRPAAEPDRGAERAAPCRHGVWRGHRRHLVGGLCDLAGARWCADELDAVGLASLADGGPAAGAGRCRRGGACAPGRAGRWRRRRRGGTAVR